MSGVETTQGSEGTRPEGPPVYENWLTAQNGVPSQAAYEVPLYTDAHITGEIREGFGPYQFLNPIALGEAPGVLLPSIVFRCENHLIWNDADMSRTDASRYHGGWLNDEIAALVSVCMGIRCKAGRTSRTFRPGDDVRGRPVGHDIGTEPVLPAWPPYHQSRLIVPRATGTHTLEDLTPVVSLPSLNPEAAVMLVRAARQYQDGLWIVETEPALAWLMLVSAVETAAQYWRADEDPVERMKISRPDVAELLHGWGGEDLLGRVASMMAPFMGATSKFVNFLLEFRPEPPIHRPAAAGRLEWEARPLKRVFSTVYNYRSKALHAGTPFPAPMCMAPFRLADDGELVETPMGGAMYTKGATWLGEDTPILLHTFEYIVRGALLNWWKALSEQPE